MKKNLSRLLALALVLASLLSLTVGATADGTKVVIPNKISRLEAQLPEREAQPTVRTKTKNGEIMVRVNGDPDTVYANWLGYDEEKEEVDLENGLGYVELEGHKYQLGAKWNNTVYRNYYVLDSKGDWVAVDYKGTVKVGNTEMKLVDFGTADINTGNFWAWIYDYINTDTTKAGDDKAVAEAMKAMSGSTEMASNIVAAGLPKQPKTPGANSNSNGQTAVTDEYFKQTIGKVDYKVEGLFDENGLLVSANVYAKDQKGNSGVKEGWTPMVPSYQFYADIHGKESNGAPNYAWIVEKGPWIATYTRAGKLEIVEKNEENTDYFKTGLAGSKGNVIWHNRKTAGGTKWYVAAVTEEYAEGDIASAEAVYNVNGQLVRYFITYRTGEDETYRIRYTTDNKPAKGNYVGIDPFTGETIKAYTASMKKWADSKTGKLTDTVELDWGLTPLKDWTNPPRLTK